MYIYGHMPDKAQTVKTKHMQVIPLGIRLLLAQPTLPIDNGMGRPLAPYRSKHRGELVTLSVSYISYKYTSLQPDIKCIEWGVKYTAKGNLLKQLSELLIETELR